jgi:hypothetical protein
MFDPIEIRTILSDMLNLPFIEWIDIDPGYYFRPEGGRSI